MSAYGRERMDFQETMPMRVSGKNTATVRPLLNLCASVIVSNSNTMANEIVQLPSTVKNKILYLMSKRSGLLNDETLSKVCTDATKQLDFTNSEITDEGLLTLPHMNRLWKLDLNATGCSNRPEITSKSLVHIARCCPNLRILYLRRCINICDAGIRALAEACPYLVEVNLSGCKLIGDDAFKALLQHCPRISKLNLAYTNITDTTLIALSNNSLAKQLEELQISNCKNITDEGIEAVTLFCVKLQCLEMQGCPLLTDTSIQAIEQAPFLTKVKQFNYTIMWN